MKKFTFSFVFIVSTMVSCWYSTGFIHDFCANNDYLNWMLFGISKQNNQLISTILTPVFFSIYLVKNKRKFNLG